MSWAHYMSCRKIRPLRTNVLVAGVATYLEPRGTLDNGPTAYTPPI